MAALLALAGCGDGDEPAGPERSTATGDAPAAKERPPATKEEMAPGKSAPAATGAVVTLRGSEFGTMLFDSKRQAIYIFQRDRHRHSVCYGGCAEAWPPVLTDGRPGAGKGVRQSLLGTIERRDGKRQVTYAGRPLYFYAHEAPGEVRCHNVHLNGGLWWVIGPDGRRRA